MAGGGANAIIVPGFAPSVSPGITYLPRRRRRNGVGDIAAANARTASLRQKAAFFSLCKDFRLSPPLSFFANGVGPTSLEIGES